MLFSFGNINYAIIFSDNVRAPIICSLFVQRGAANIRVCTGAQTPHRRMQTSKYFSKVLITYIISTHVPWFNVHTIKKINLAWPTLPACTNVYCINICTILWQILLFKLKHSQIKTKSVPNAIITLITLHYKGAVPLEPTLVTSLPLLNSLALVSGFCSSVTNRTPERRSRSGRTKRVCLPKQLASPPTGRGY